MPKGVVDQPFVVDFQDPATGQPASIEFAQRPSPEEIDQVINAQLQQAGFGPRPPAPTPEGAIQRTPGLTMRPGAQVAAATGRAVGEFAKQEALPMAAVTGVSALFPPAGPTAGVATRVALGAGRLLATGGAGVAGQAATRAIRGQPPPTTMERVGEFVFSATPVQARETALGPRTARRLVDGLAGLFGRRGKTEVGVRLQRNLFQIREAATIKLNRVFTVARAQADALDLTTVLSKDSFNALMRAVQETDEAVRPALLEVLQPLINADRFGKPITYGELSTAVRNLTPFQTRLKIGARHLGPSEIDALSSALRSDMRNMAVGTKAQKAVEAANDFYVGEHLPLLKTLKQLEAGTALPSNVVGLLAAEPDRLSLVFKNIPKAEQEQVRAAFFTDLLHRSQDLAKVENVTELIRPWQKLDPASRALLSGNHAKEVARIFERLESITRSEKYVQQYRLLQSGTLITMGSALGFALSQGDLFSALPVLLGTVAGVHIMARMFANGAARRTFRRGLLSSGKQRGQLLLQAFERIGVDFAATESRLPGMAQPPSPSGGRAQPGPLAIQAGP